MVEHVLAALFALKIDNVHVHCTSCEMPGMDGSSHAYALALQEAGRRSQPFTKDVYVIRDSLRFGNETQWISAEPTSTDSLNIEYILDYGPTSSIGRGSFASEVSEEVFLRDLAEARTFLTLAEAQALQSKGLAQHVTHRDLLVFGDAGPIDNVLRFADECPRHKALDLLGDLALAGVDLVGKITAHRSGHQLNGRLAETIRQSFVHSREALRHVA
ncbi:MAG: UDP-3-O-acyl-N-acetylglucosamine deacetylase [Pirellulales bacterium]